MIYYIQIGRALFHTEPTDGITILDETDVDDIVGRLSEERVLGLDTETEGFDPHTCNMLLFQIGNRDYQVVFDASYINHPAVRRLLQNPEILFILHNAKFDLKFLMKHNVHMNTIFDTFLAECVLTTGYGYGEAELSLKDVTLKYVNKERDKSIRGKINYLGIVKPVIVYAADDVVDLEDIMIAQLVELQKWGLMNVMELENDVVKVFAHMEYVGVHVDRAKWTEVQVDIESEHKRILEDLDSIVLADAKLSAVYKPKYVQGDLFGFEKRELEINWNSPAQKLKILQVLGFKIDSSDAANLAKLKGKHKIIAQLIEYAKFQKLESSFGPKFLNFINPKTGRVHFNVWQVLSTGRVSFSSPNLAQIPGRTPLGKRMRKAFTAEPGYKIAGGDFAQFELRIIANFSEDPLWIETFKKGDDLHSVICSKVFNIPIEDVKKPSHFKADIVYRDIAKSVGFGLSYGMSEHKLASTIEVSTQVAKQIIDQFFSVVPKVKEFLDTLGNTGKIRGYIKSAPPYSRIRWFPQWKSVAENPFSSDTFKVLGEIERQSKNMPIQGCNADVVKDVLRTLYRIKMSDTKNNNVKIILSVYDKFCRSKISLIAGNS